jgi:hypothetical protein
LGIAQIADPVRQTGPDVLNLIAIQRKVAANGAAGFVPQ